MSGVAQADYIQDCRLESNEIQIRKLWRLPGLKQSTYPGIQEGFTVLKTNQTTGESDRQYFISNRPESEWKSREVLERILLHWDTETGVFGIKDNTFYEDKVRYASLAGVEAHVGLLNIAWNCLQAPVLRYYWKEDSMRCRIQFLKDHPDYNPFQMTF